MVGKVKNIDKNVEAWNALRMPAVIHVGCSVVTVAQR